MSESVGVRELRQNLSRYLDRVKVGENLLVTERGRVVARLIPAGTDAYAEIAAEFGATIPDRTIEEVVAGLGPRSAPAGTTDAYLAESRGDWRP